MASAPSSESMAAILQSLLTKMNKAIELMQSLRRETAAIVAALFPGAT